MRARTSAAITLSAITAILAAAPAHAAPVASAAATCRAVPDILPTGVKPVWAVRIKTRNTSCRIARSLPAKVILNFRYGAMNPGEYGKNALGISAWSCRSLDSGWPWRTVCTASGARRVRWQEGDTARG